MRSRFWAILEAVILTVLIITLVLFIQAVYSKGAKCVANPLVYGSKVLTEMNNDSFSCICSFDSKPDFPIYANSKEWGFKEGQLNYNFTPSSFDFPEVAKGG